MTPIGDEGMKGHSYRHHRFSASMFAKRAQLVSSRFCSRYAPALVRSPTLSCALLAACVVVASLCFLPSHVNTSLPLHDVDNSEHSFSWQALRLPRLGLVGGMPSTWDGIAEIGPAVSPAAWRASQPVVLLMAYPAWHGVFSAARAQGPVLGMYLDFTARAQQRLVSLIAATPSLRCVIVHGIPHHSVDFARLLKHQVPAVRIMFVYHGTASAPFHVEESSLVASLVDATLENAVDAIGVVKVGFGSVFHSLGVPPDRVFTVPNFPTVSLVLPTNKYSEFDGRAHIGILVSSGDVHKNVGSQLVSACSIPDAIVHVTFRPRLAYLRNCSIVETGWLSHGRFLLEAARMDVLMYVSLTEAFPMLVLEAINLGIPVVVSRTHHLLESDKVLDDALVVAESDNPENIRTVLLGAIERRVELLPHLLALAACMRHKAEFSWGSVLNLSRTESTRLQLLAFAHRRDGEDVATYKCPSSMTQAAPASTTTFSSLLSSMTSLSPLRIAFVTYELTPGVSGGAGVVISNLVEELLAKGHFATVIAHVSTSALDVWARAMEARGWRVGPKSQLTIHHVPTLVDEVTLECGPRNVFLRRSGIFAIAAQLAYAAQPFDAIEVFEYAGAAFELLRRQREWLAADALGSTKGVAPPYLPLHVPIFVRLHGSLQLIQQSEGLLVAGDLPSTPPPCLSAFDERAAWPLMRLMERYTLLAAHTLFPQSRAMIGVYKTAYGLDDTRMVLAPPPMERILAATTSRSADSQGIAGAPRLHFSVSQGAEFLLSRTGASSDTNFQQNRIAPTQLRLLVYGRVAHMKGAETVAAAAGAIQEGLPDNVQLQLVFVGIDWDCPVHGRPTSQCVIALLPSNVHATFRGPVERSEMPQLVASVHGGIIASEFETYGLAAHELAAAGLPLIISNIHAFAEFFTEENAYTFRAGDADDLARAALRFAADLELRRARVASDLNYPDAIEPYVRAVAAARANPSVASTVDTRLVEAAIAAHEGVLEGACWPSEECRVVGMQALTSTASG